MIYKPRNFILQELVSPDVYAARGTRCWELLDAMALMSLQSVRDTFGAIVVNNWHEGGSFSESGLRSATTTTGAKLSQHRYGRAFDCKCKTATPQEMCDYIVANRELFPYVTVIENPQETPSWLHFDTRNSQREEIWIVTP